MMTPFTYSNETLYSFCELHRGPPNVPPVGLPYRHQIIPKDANPVCTQ